LASQDGIDTVTLYNWRKATRGNCLGNSPMERLLRSLKSEWVPDLGYRTLPDAKKDVGSYLMEYYNQQRPLAFSGGI